MSERKKNKNGFTLVEMMLVVCILCLLVAVLIKGVNDYLDKGNAASETVSAASATIENAFNNRICKE